jgi:hypothetical protein
MLKKIESRRQELHELCVDKQEREERGAIVGQLPTDFTMMPLPILRGTQARRKSDVRSAESKSREDSMV